MRRRDLLRYALGGLPALTAGFRILPARADPGILRVAINADIRGTNPFGNRDQNTDMVLLHCIEGLVAFTEKADVAPMLAEGWTVSQDGTTYTFKLRDDVTFHNGAVLTSDDVVWAWHRLLDPALQWRGLPDFDGRGATKVLDVKAGDPRTVVFTIDRPTALFVVNMARPDYGSSAILHRTSWDSKGAWVSPVGTGPFRLGMWQPGRSVTLERFPSYVSLPGPRDGYTGGKHALVDRVAMDVVPDDNASIAALSGGSMDVVWPVSPSAAQALDGRRGVMTDIAPIMDMYAVLMQTRMGLLSDG